jgi:UDP-N-acetylglucosamine acyltransferase
MVGAHIAHDSHVGDRCILANNVLLAGHITIDDCAVLSGGVAIHHYVRVGRYSFVGGNSGVVHDCPPYMNSDGHPARVRSINLIGLHRHGFSEQTIENLKAVCRMLYKRENGNQADVIDRVEREFGDDPACREVCDFARIAAEGPNGRQREAQRKDNKRKSPTR